MRGSRRARAAGSSRRARGRQRQQQSSIRLVSPRAWRAAAPPAAARPRHAPASGGRWRPLGWPARRARSGRPLRPRQTERRAARRRAPPPAPPPRATTTPAGRRRQSGSAAAPPPSGRQRLQQRGAWQPTWQPRRRSSGGAACVRRRRAAVSERAAAGHPRSCLGELAALGEALGGGLRARARCTASWRACDARRFGAAT